MKKTFIFTMMAVVAACLVVGCAGGVKTYTDSGQAINVGANQEFIIALSSNPTTGFQWQESHDEAALELVEKTYKLGEQAEEGMVGAGGIDYFRFKALKTGTTEITIVYKRPWEKDSIDQKVFTVNID